MKINVRATHKVLPTVEEYIDSEDLPELMGKLIHFGYDIEHEEMLGWFELDVFKRRKNEKYD